LAASTALGRAIRNLGKRDGLFIRPFASPNKDAVSSYGVYLVKGHGEAGDDHQCGARVRVQATLAGQQVQESIVPLPPERGQLVDVAFTLAEEIVGDATWLITNGTGEDISAALVKIVTKLAGSPLRNKGGLYLLPLSSCDTWAALMPVLRTIGVEPIRIEMHDAPDNVRAARTAAKGALEEDIAALLADLEKANQGRNEKGRNMDLGHRIAECNAIAARAALYRNVLTDMAEAITKKCAAMATAFRTTMVGGKVRDSVLGALMEPLEDNGESETPEGKRLVLVNKTPPSTAIFGLIPPADDDDD
jgi:hypothetical protein